MKPLPLLALCLKLIAALACTGCGSIVQADEYDDLGCYVGGKSREAWYAEKRADEMRAMYAPANNPVQPSVSLRPNDVRPAVEPGDFFRHTACFWEHNVFRVARVERGPKGWIVYRTGTATEPTEAKYVDPVPVEHLRADDLQAILADEQLAELRAAARRKRVRPVVERSSFGVPLWDQEDYDRERDAMRRGKFGG